MTDFEKMMNDIIAEEEKRLGVGSPEFMKKHEEIMSGLENWQKKAPASPREASGAQTNIHLYSTPEEGELSTYNAGIYEKILSLYRLELVRMARCRDKRTDAHTVLDCLECLAEIEAECLLRERMGCNGVDR